MAALATAVRQWCCNLRWHFACWFDGIRALYATLPDKAFIALPLDGPAIAATGGMGRRLPDGAAPTGWSASSPEVACAGKTQRYILLLLLSSSSPRRARSLNAPNPKSTQCTAVSCGAQERTDSTVVPCGDRHPRSESAIILNSSSSTLSPSRVRKKVLLFPALHPLTRHQACVDLLHLLVRAVLDELSLQHN